MTFVFQIGAREHYAIPRALHASGALAGLFTDFWVPPGHFLGRLPSARRLNDRFHGELEDARVHPPNTRFLAFELQQRLAKRHGWPTIIERNRLFQKLAIAKLSSLAPDSCLLSPVSSHLAPLGKSATVIDTPLQVTVFSYSYAALEIFRFAKARGWRTVLGQIDPGPGEERIVAAEHQRYPHLASRWQPAPPEYWENWRQEIDLADRILVNSEWSRQCLLKEGVAEDKLEVVPLVYGEKTQDFKTQDARFEEQSIQHSEFNIQNSHAKRVLFLGQINLRKGVGRLLDAMRLLKDEAIELILAGPTEIDPVVWADLPNVKWVGLVARSEVGRYYAEADLFVLPTLSDGYAITQLEALSHGLPVLASKHCGDAVTHGLNGWILDNLEPETIAANVRQAMSESLPNVRPPEFSLADLAAALMR
jgi:glycosyltransferase involved in cell wall biosynthesis